MKRKVGILVGALLAGATGLAGPASGGEADRVAAGIPEARREALAHRVLHLQREYRLRHRAAAMLSEAALFDDLTARGRRVPPSAAQGVVTVRNPGNGYEAVGVGGTEARMADGGLDALRRKILDLKRQLEQRKK